MRRLQKYSPKRLALTAAVAGGLTWSCAYAEPRQDNAARPGVVSPATSPTQTHSPYHANGRSSRAIRQYQAAWGVDDMWVRRTASGTLVRFSYRVTDAERAKILGDKEATPHLVDPKRGVILEIPVMENIGQLRQTGTPVVGQEYWMVFSNKGDVVKAGDRVDVLIGTFHADGLLVE
jgi:hypothetical protein